MSISQALRCTIRRLLERSHYWVRHESVLPYGVGYQHDIQRLAVIFGQPIKVFFDVGANTGQTSAEALKSFPAADVFAFEPDKTSFSTLTATMTDRRFRSFNIALSNKSGEAPFFDYGALATSNSLVENSEYASRIKHDVIVRTVHCDTVDSICSNIGITNIDVLKIDTEGHDLAVLQGAERMLAEHRVRFVYVEFNTMLPVRGSTGGALIPISEILESQGFRFVASYPEYMITSGDFFATSNALFVRPPPAV